MFLLKSKLRAVSPAFLWLSALAALAGVGASPAAAQTYNCLPSCSSVDTRFLAIANGAGFITLSQPTLDLMISVPAGTSSFTIGVFDGDARGTDGTGVAHWDFGSPASFSYTLFADPLANRTGTTVVPLGGFPSVPSASMLDNRWIDFTVNTSAAAQAPSGNYFYYLRIQLTDTAVAMTNAFKVRTRGAQVGGSKLFRVTEPFSYIANIAGVADAQIAYPNYPALNPSNYDGTFSFFFDMPVTPQDMAVWDGDFDRGKFNGTDLDTDDPDTPPSLPPWRTVDTLPEGVATGVATPAGTNPATTTGSPPDDRNPGTTVASQALLKSPSIRYELVFPDGQVFSNDNPSGNQEWEQLRISRDLYDPSTMDYSTPDIPHGIYEVRIKGVDLQNLNALLFPGRTLCVGEDGAPCEPLRPFLVGDTVFNDANGNSIQDRGEPGIPGVILELYDYAGVLIATAATGAGGYYVFPVEEGSYTVRVPPPGDANPALRGYGPTTREECTAEISDHNVDNCDFGYRGTASVGGRLWLDADCDGIQDSGETGIKDAVVELLDSGSNVIAKATTDGAGHYMFPYLLGGAYTVRAAVSSLPGGLVPTYDLDGVDTAHTATFILAAGASRMDADFGYRGSLSIGDRVWLDANGNGVQDGNEAGINGVVVQLLDGSSTVIATTTTSGNGNYTFDNREAGIYTVRIVSCTLPAGYQATYDLDGIATMHTATLSLNTSRADVDFGYGPPAKTLGTSTLSYHGSSYPAMAIGDWLWRSGR